MKEVREKIENKLDEWFQSKWDTGLDYDEAKKLYAKELEALFKSEMKRIIKKSKPKFEGEEIVKGICDLVVSEYEQALIQKITESGVSSKRQQDSTDVTE